MRFHAKAAGRSLLTLFCATGALLAAGGDYESAEDALDADYLTGGIIAIDEAIPGKILLDGRLRFENLEKEGKLDSEAWTTRLRLGYETPDFAGITLLAEFEGTTRLNDGEDFDTFDSEGGKHVVIADPNNAELNRLQLHYQGEELANTAITLGRQRIKIDNERFIGNENWRQNERTYDGLKLVNTYLDKTTLTYAYIKQVNLEYGDKAPTGAEQRMHGNVHAINGKYAIDEQIALAAYAYLMDFNDEHVGSSSDTYGIFLDGTYPLDEQSGLTFRAEYARQQDAGDNTSSYEADYYHLKAGGYFDAVSAGLGYEVLGEDNGVGFQTPLASGHYFNGAADTFLSTPSTGVQDFYVWAQVDLFDHYLKIKGEYHNYEADSGSKELGDEFNAALIWKLNKNWKLKATYADFSGNTDAKTKDKTKSTVELNYHY